MLLGSSAPVLLFSSSELLSPIHHNCPGHSDAGILPNLQAVSRALSQLLYQIGWSVAHQPHDSAMWQVPGWSLVSNPLILLEACPLEQKARRLLSKVLQTTRGGSDPFPRQTVFVLPAMTLDRSYSSQVRAETRASWAPCCSLPLAIGALHRRFGLKGKRDETFLRQASRDLFLVPVPLERIRVSLSK